MTYLLENAGEGEALQGTLASMVDMMQVMADDGKMCPILNAAAVALAPHDSPEGAGAADTTIRVLKAHADGMPTIPGQERIRIDIFMRDNLP